MQRYASDMLAELDFTNARSATAPLPPGASMDKAPDGLPLNRSALLPSSSRQARLHGQLLARDRVPVR
jgi:hypothetical protein